MVQPNCSSFPRWNHGRVVSLLLAVVLLGGCAAGGPAPPTIAEPHPPVVRGPVVEHLSGGRKGFNIKETVSLEGAARSDFDKGVALLQSGDFAGAVDLLEKVIAQEPGVTAPYIDIAIAYRGLDKTEEAEAALQKALELVPAHPVASNEYGLLLRSAGRFDEARKVYEAALKEFPEYLPGRRNLGVLCDIYLNDPSCALEQFEIYSAASPGEEQVGVWIADLRLRLGKN